MHDEHIVWAQENVDAKTPEQWRDIDVPRVRDGLPPRQRPVTVREWAERLTHNGMVGVYRAYTTRQRVVAIVITAKQAYSWRVEDVTR